MFRRFYAVVTVVRAAPPTAALQADVFPRRKTAVAQQAASFAVGAVVDFTDTGQCATADIGAKFAAFNRA